MNRNLTAAVLLMVSASALAMPSVPAPRIEKGEAPATAVRPDATPRRGDFAAPQTYPYAAGERREIHGARPSEEELACVTWGACRPGDRRG